MSQIEMLSIEDFAERMKISRATAFEWLRKKILIEGRHYIRIGRVIRIPWSQELVQLFLEDCANPPTNERPQPATTKVKVPRKTKVGPQINWDYK